MHALHAAWAWVDANLVGNLTADIVFAALGFLAGRPHWRRHRAKVDETHRLVTELHRKAHE
jgi:hypothetical protein